jgi:hypothetical protein
MRRLQSIHEEEVQHEERLRGAWLDLAATCGGDADRFAADWLRLVERWDFTAVNLLIDKHNRYFPAESRLPMDPRTGDFILVGGRPYRREPLGRKWVLERFPPELENARSASAVAAA